MSAEFDAIVTLCRKAVDYKLRGTTLCISIRNSAEIDQLTTTASAYRQADVYVAGVQQHRALSTINEGTLVELRFLGLTSNDKVLAQNLEDLLSYQQGLFLYRAPQEYFLLEEEYATGDADTPELVKAYQTAPKFFDLIRAVSDVVLRDGTATPEFVVLAGKRLDLVVKYDVDTLKALPSAETIDSFSVELQTPPFVEAKKSIFKKVLVRLLEATPQEERASALARLFSTAKQSFAADFDLYTTEFNFDKVRESFEQKRLAFVLQLNATTSDLLGKMLAIPIGQGLVVSQFKNEATSSVGNVALLLGSIVFAVFALMLILNQHQSLKQIKQEIKIENESVRTLFPQLHVRIEEMFTLLRRRARLHTWAFPAVVTALLIATTTYSILAFMKVPPYARSIAETSATDKGARVLNPRAEQAQREGLEATRKRQAVEENSSKEPDSSQN